MSPSEAQRVSEAIDEVEAQAVAPVPVPAPVSDSLAARAKNSTFWALTNQVGNIVLRLGSNLILTRLLSPADFGLMAVVNLVLLGLHMVTDVGINAAIMSSKRGAEPTFLHTAFTVQVLRGALISAFTALGAWPVAVYGKDPRLVELMLVTSLVAVIQGFTSTRMAQATRAMNLRMNIVTELGSQVVQLVATIGLALWLHDTRALVWGGVLQVVAWVALSHWLIEGERDAFGWDREAAHEMFHLAKWILVSTATMFLASRFDVIVLARYIAKSDLGVYGQALVVAGLPFQLVNPLIDNVMYPAMSAMHRHNADDYPAAVRRSRRRVLPAITLVILGAAFAAPSFYYLFYKREFHAAAWQAQLCLTGTWFLCLSETAVRAALAMGSARPMAQSNLARFGVSAVAVIGGYKLFGLTGAILGATLGALGAHAVTLYSLRRSGIHLAMVDASFSLFTFAALAFGAWVPHYVARWIDWPWQIISIGTGTLLLIPLGLWALFGIKALAKQ